MNCNCGGVMQELQYHLATYKSCPACKRVYLPPQFKEQVASYDEAKEMKRTVTQSNGM